MSGEVLSVVEPPREQLLLVAKIMATGAADLRAAFDIKPPGTFLAVWLDVDDVENPRRLLAVDLTVTTVAELAAQDPKAARDAAEGFNLAERVGQKAALFVVRGNGRCVLMVRSIDNLAGGPHVG